jgi:iron complex outermembrane receptor protein
MSASASYFKLDSKNAYGFSTFGGISTNIYAPVQVAAPPATFFTGGILFSPRTTNESETTSLALADTLSFNDDAVLVTLGGRYQIIEQHSFDYNTGAELSGYDEDTLTPMFGVVVKPTDRISLYANYIEGLLQGEAVPAVVNGVQVRNVG